MNQETATVIFQPSGRRGSVPRGITIVEASRLLGVDIESPCGDHQVCGKCRVRIEDGIFEKFGIRSSQQHLSAPAAPELEIIDAGELAEGFRLGCAATILGDLLIYVPESTRGSQQVVSKAAGQLDVDLDPAVKLYRIKVPHATLGDGGADFERISRVLAAEYDLADLEIHLEALRSLPDALRRGEWQITAAIWMDREIIDISPGATTRCYGMAFDIGTTTIAGYLCDLTTGTVIATVSAMNPQVKYGEDVVSRISYHMGNPDGLARMSRDVIATVNRLIAEAVASLAPPPLQDTTAPPLTAANILELAFCSNTAMHHILLQLDPEPLGSIPFSPTIHRGLHLQCRDLGLHVHPGAKAYFLPSIAGYVGGDTIGVMLAETPQETDAVQLIIDIGTNGELVLGNRERLICSSCATGPALEGAQIEFGMRAAPGAIERVRIDPATWEVDYKVIGKNAWRQYSEPAEMQARGICGSGILDALGELLLAGIVAKSGAFSAKARECRRFRQNLKTGFNEFILAWAEETSIGKDIVITQKDIRQIQMAKASIYTGCKLMMKKLGISSPDSIKIAGAFGSHVNTHLARVIGMIPDCPQHIVRSVGNAAGDGCRAALINRHKRAEADRLCRTVEYLELTLEESFQQELVGATQLPHMVDEFTNLKQL